MAIVRDDRYVTDAQGRALAGAQVYWCTQPATTSANPPYPLATLYTSTSGGTQLTQPVLTDGFGHAYAYMDDSVLYTVVVWHPLFGTSPVVLPDQSVGGGGTLGWTPFSGTLIGAVNGTNTQFQLANGTTPLTVLPVQATVWLNFPLVLGVGYTLALIGGYATVTFSRAPQPASGGNPAETVYAQGFFIP